MKTLTCIIFSALVFSSSAMAEKFVVSATTGTDILVATFELKQNNQIKREHSSVIGTSYGIYNTAVTFRKNNNATIFDVYYPVETGYDQPLTEMEMNRLDSNLNLKFEKDFTGIPSGYTFDLAGLRGPSGLTRFLLMDQLTDQPPGRVIVERKLAANGSPGPESIAFRHPPNSFLLDSTVAEDGKMLVAATENNKSQRFIQVRKFPPAGPIRVKQTANIPVSLSLSDPIKTASRSPSAGSVAGTYRFLFFRAFGDLEQIQSTRILVQKIENSTGNFVGAPRTFTITARSAFKECCVTHKFLQSVAVTPGADVVFYTEFDASCGKNILRGQVFNAQRGTKIGRPQLLIGCSQMTTNQVGISGIDVAQFAP